MPVGIPAGYINKAKNLIGKLPGMSSASAAAYIDRGGRAAGKYQARAVKTYDALNARSGGTGPQAQAAMSMLSNTTRDLFIRNNMIRQRQMALGLRYGAGAVGGSVAVNAARRPGPNRNQGGYNPAGARPYMSAPPGTGRYA